MVNVKENEQLSILNHSCAHLLAHAVKRIYPDALFWVGPVIEEGFYYDIDLGDKVVNDEILEAISKEMKKIVKEDKLIKRLELSKEAALEMFKNDPYKIDIIENLADDEIISAYKQEEFVDLCRGPHVKSTKLLKNFKLLKHSGAYYKGDSNNKMLQRIYGICFEKEEELQAHLDWIEEAKKRDHRRLGKDLELFMISEYGPGFPFFLPNGMILRKQLEDFWYEEHRKEGYEFIKTPIMLNQELWEISGHWFNYKENMYTSEIDDKAFAIKPMNCPGGMLVYKNSLHSYKDLPIRSGELGLVHRHEASGALSGLFRVRNFTQDDAHIFMREDQMESEIVRLVGFIDRMYKLFGLSYHVELSTRPEDKFIGEIETWNRAEQILQDALKKAGKDFVLNPGDGAFYGPKLDFKVKDSLGREWQCGTIQLDMQLPERFDLTYIDADGSKKRPVMLHRVIYGSIERFIGILIEHFAGCFPLWMAPVQVNVIPVKNEYHLEYAEKVVKLLEEKGLRVKLDAREEKLGYRMREAQTKKYNYNLILGNAERDENKISFRKHGSEETVSMEINEFVEMLEKEIANKEINK
ncbi:MAG: threonine--tRNA ligase [Bacilli bacterium]|jgi:threonyl-tRNA synthetase|nr:threonine--tRNA ligase [Bacilli bacterium]